MPPRSNLLLRATRLRSTISKFAILGRLREIEQILHLRHAIDLSVHAAAGAEFVEREKKETSAVLSVPSNCAGKS